MLRITALCALAAAACLAASPAGAVTFSGTAVFDEFGEALVQGPLVSTPGTYRYEFTLSSPAFAQLELIDVLSYDFYDADDGTYYGGNDAPNYLTTDFLSSPVTRGGTFYTLRPPYEDLDFPILEKGFYHLDGALLHLYLPQDQNLLTAARSVDYTFSVTLVPEPAAWTLMIAGFGFAGAALRRRRAAAHTVTPA
jgi:hypothetical protein